MRTRTKSISILLAATTSALFASVFTAQEASAADLILGSNPYVANTTALTLTGPSVNVHGTNVGGVAVFTFHNITVPAGGSITAKGSRPFELRATGALVVSGAVLSNGADAVRGNLASGTGGAGGGNGGIRTTDSSTVHGGGPGGGVAGTVDHNNGGGGGGFGGRGARGGTCGISECPTEAGHGGAAGPAYGDLNVRLQGGSGGGPGASDARGGGGGGALGLFGASVTINLGAAVLANGGSGDTGSGGASGGGSGGGVLIHGNSVTVDGVVQAIGGSGGAGGCCGDGGGGGGGRIAVQYKTFVSHTQSIYQVFGGTSGTNSSGAYGHGGLSPDLTGINGFVTHAQIDASKLSISASRSITKGHATTTGTRLTDAGTGAGLGGRTVTLWKKPEAGGSWTKIATKTTGSGGATSVTVKPGSSTIYQWRFAGTLIHLKASSPTQTITVH